MRTRRMNEVSGQSTWVVVLETGDEAMACLRQFAAEEGLDSASFSAIGAFERARLAYFDWESKEYMPIPVHEQVEVASLNGDIVLGQDGKPVVHVHAVLGRRDGSAMAGHLEEAIVRPTLELVLTETPGELRKQMDQDSGLPLLVP
jgi:predicted DNA-binding protein with PD1-like motif